jgi:hypothetical protein
MKEKSSKQEKKSNPSVELKDLKPTKDSKGQAAVRGRMMPMAETHKRLERL